MQLTDIMVEVRDKGLNRLGQIRPEDLDLEYAGAFNNTGKWTLTLAADHPMAEVLRAPGGGIIVTGPEDTLFSGPAVKPERASTPTDIGGTLTIEGVTDDVILADALAWPDPANPDVTTQSLGHDERAGAAETLLHQFVDANIGPSAPAVRRKANLVMGADGGRGAGVVKRARFPVLGALLEEIALGNDLGFRVIQRGAQLVFETFLVTDRTAFIRLDVKNGNLAGQRVATTPPGVTRVIVAGQGELEERTFVQRDSAASITAEDAWGRRIERFVDQRQTDIIEELQQAGDELLAEEGQSGLAVQVVPSGDTAMRFGHDWYMGDKVTVVVDDQELHSLVVGVVIKVDKDGIQVGAQLGETVGFSLEAALQKRLATAEQRVSQLERVEPPATTGSTAQTVTFAIAVPTTTWTLPHNFGTQSVRVQSYDSGGIEVFGDVSTPDGNTAVITWYFPTSGSARVTTS